MPNIIPLPTPTFQAPGFVHPNDYSGLAHSIDSIFTAYQQGQMRRAQLDNQETQNQLGQQQLANAQQAGAIQGADYRMQNFGLSPQDVSQNMGAAMQPAPQGGSLYAATQQGAPMRPDQMAQAGVSNPNAYAAPAQEDPKVAVLRQILQMHMQGAQVGAQQQQAGLQNVQANIGKTQAETEKLNTENQMLSGANGIVGNLTNQIKSGNMAPESLGNMGRGDLANSVRLGVVGNLAASGTNVQSLQNQADASNVGAKGQADVQHKMGQVVGTAAGTLEDVLNKVEPIISKLNTSQLSLLNDAWAKGLRHVNDPKAQAALVYLNEAKGLYASVIGNGAATDPDKQAAAESISHGLNRQGFGGMKEAVLFTAQSKMKRLQGQGYNEPAPSISEPAAKWDGGATHTYPDGTRAQFNGTAWVRVP